MGLFKRKRQESAAGPADRSPVPPAADDVSTGMAEPVQQSAAAYIFEVARREFGGRYLSYSDDDPIVLVVGEPEFQAGLCGMSKVCGRVRLGNEDNIPFFYDGLVAAVCRRSSATIV